MKVFLSVLLFVMGGSALAEECTNFSGTYLMEFSKSDRIYFKIVQDNCDALVLTTHRGSVDSSSFGAFIYRKQNPRVIAAQFSTNNAVTTQALFSDYFIQANYIGTKKNGFVEFTQYSLDEKGNLFIEYHHSDLPVRTETLPKI